MFFKRKIIEYYCNGLLVYSFCNGLIYYSFFSSYYCIRIDLILGGGSSLGGDISVPPSVCNPTPRQYIPLDKYPVALELLHNSLISVE